MPRPQNTTNEHYYDPFPTKLRELTASHGTTQEELKEVLGVKRRQSVTGYTDGSTAPTPEKIIAIAKYFNVSADELLGIRNQETGLSAEAAAMIKAWSKERYALKGLTAHNEIEYPLPTLYDTFEKMVECKEFEPFLFELAGVGARIDLEVKLSQYEEYDPVSFEDHVGFSVYKYLQKAERLVREMYAISDIQQALEEEEADNGKHQ